MADTFQYGLTYAGVPFLGDNGWTFAPDADGAQSPEAAVLLELERRMRPEFLQDFYLPSYRQGSESDLPMPYDSYPVPSSDLKVGDWYYPNNASRWSVFRGLMTSTMYKTALAATGGYQAATFVMKAAPVAPDNPNGVALPYTLTTSMFMLPGRPLAEHGAGFAGVYLITLVDERYYWQGSPVSLTVRAWTTWDDLIDELGTALGVSIDYSPIESVYGKPEPDSQLWCRSAPAPLLLDAVAANLGRVVVRRLDGTVLLLTYAESADQSQANRGPAKTVVRFAGGDIFSSGNVVKAGNLTAAKNSVVPERVIVSFPKYVVADPVPHFLNARYQNPRPSAWVEDSYGGTHEVVVPAVSGLEGTGDYTIRGQAKALISGEADLVPVNVSGLEALANRIAVDYYDSLALQALDEVYPGTFDWTLEGIHDVVWTYSASRQLATTRVLRRAWTNGVLNSQHGTPYLSGQEVNPIGVGGKSVAQTWRDSYGDVVSTSLYSSGNVPIGSGDQYLLLKSPGGFPTQNRWRAIIGSGERLLMEGTSGGVLRGLSGEYRVDVAYRGIDGTQPAQHASGAILTQVVPNTTYGVNLLTLDKMTFVHPSDWTSGGVLGAKLVAQTQTVTALAGSGFINAVSGLVSGAVTSGFASGIPEGTWFYYSGRVNPVQLNSGFFTDQEFCWIVERNNGVVYQGNRYDGQFVGYSYGDDPAPVYAVNGVSYPKSGINSGGSIPLVTNVCPDRFPVFPGKNIEFDFTLSGGVTINCTVNGSGNVYSGAATLTGTSPWGLILVGGDSPYTVELPDPTLVQDATYTFKKTGLSGSTVTVFAGAFTIDGASNYSLTAKWEYVTVKPQSQAWYVVGNGRPS